jgi:hypothetical protein
MITFDTAIERATSVSNFTAVMIVSGESLIAYGTYRDQLARRGDAWMFTEKQHEVQSLGAYPSYPVSSLKATWRS